jgi:cytidylate kinase
MATDKRARQRANREEKKAAEAKAKMRARRWQIVRRYATYTLVFAIGIILLRIFFG